MYKNRTLKTSAPWRAIQVQRCCKLLRLINEGICAIMNNQIYQTSQLASQMCDDEMVSTCKNLNSLNTCLEQNIFYKKNTWMDFRMTLCRHIALSTAVLKLNVLRNILFLFMLVSWFFFNISIIYSFVTSFSRKYSIKWLMV